MLHLGQKDGNWLDLIQSHLSSNVQGLSYLLFHHCQDTEYECHILRYQEVLKVLLNKRTKGIPLAKNDEELDKVVKLTKGFSNRDLTILTDKAALIARKDNRRAMVASDFNTPVAENQNMKVKEEYYQSKQNRPSIGFSGSSTANATVKTNKSLNYIG